MKQGVVQCIILWLVIQGQAAVATKWPWHPFPLPHPPASSVGSTPRSQMGHVIPPERSGSAHWSSVSSACPKTPEGRWSRAILKMFEVPKLASYPKGVVKLCAQSQRVTPSTMPDKLISATCICDIPLLDQKPQDHKSGLGHRSTSKLRALPTGSAPHSPRQPSNTCVTADAATICLSNLWSILALLVRTSRHLEALHLEQQLTPNPGSAIFQ